MSRDETRDVLINSHGIALKWRGGEYLSGTTWERFCPHHQLVDLERQLAEFVEDRGEQVERMLLEKHDLEHQLAEREDAIMKLQEAMNELRKAMRDAIEFLDAGDTAAARGFLSRALEANPCK